MKKETSEKKSFYRFLLIMAASLVVGGVVGWLTCHVDTDAIYNLMYGSLDALAVIIPVVTIAVNVVLLCIFFCHYSKAKRLFSTMDEDDEEAHDAVDKGLSLALMPGSICLILNFALFSIGCELANQPELNDIQFNVVMLTALAGMILGLVWIIASQNAVVKLVKRLNPEKRGSVFDMNFQKQWMGSCDEGEQLITYKAAYKSFRATSMTCTLMWLVCMLAQITFHTGWFPTVCVCTIYLVQNVSYFREALRLEHGK